MAKAAAAAQKRLHKDTFIFERENLQQRQQSEAQGASGDESMGENKEDEVDSITGAGEELDATNFKLLEENFFELTCLIKEQNVLKRALKKDIRQATKELKVLCPDLSPTSSDPEDSDMVESDNEEAEDSNTVESDNDEAEGVLGSWKKQLAVARQIEFKNDKELEDLRYELAGLEEALAIRFEFLGTMGGDHA
ncbi:hypothetical protein BGZ82_011059 [Podila clonocystis]|nr:hypothetical protein BGZ82_011059 [Podila clonocystis]